MGLMSTCSGSVKGSGLGAEDDTGWRKVGVYIMTVPRREEERSVESREKRVDSDLDCDGDRVCVRIVAGALWSSLSHSEMPCEGNGKGVVSSMS